MWPCTPYACDVHVAKGFLDCRLGEILFRCSMYALYLVKTIGPCCPATNMTTRSVSYRYVATMAVVRRRWGLFVLNWIVLEWRTGTGIGSPGAVVVCGGLYNYGVDERG